MMEKQKPKFLYRGIKIRYELLKDFEFYGVDINPPYEPIVDENGRKTVGDGNEYGVYMTDHDIVARDAYAAVKENDGTPIDKTIMFGEYKERIMIPAVGIVYKIDTNNLDVHIPWITSYLRGHYNNGMGGDEWIADSIPSSNYSIDTIEIGPDTLHDSEMIEVEDVVTVKQSIIEKIEARKARLELFGRKMKSIPERERLLMTSSRIAVLRSIYKLNGIMDIDPYTFEPTTLEDYLDYLMAITYRSDKDNLDYTTLEYIQALKGKIRKIASPEDLVELLNTDITSNEEKKNKFISKKVMQNEEYSTASFDKRSDMYNKLKMQLETKINSTKQKTTVDTQRLGKETLDMQKDTRKIDEVEQQINMQMREQTQPKEESHEVKEDGDDYVM